MLFLQRKFIPAFFALLIGLLAADNAAAALLTVTTLDDTNDSICNSHCSLREAISAAANDDTIIFARELRGGTLQLTGTLLIEKRLTIDGPNKRRISLKGNNTFRIIEVRNGFPSLDGLIIRDGHAADGDGGGIYVNPNGGGSVNITNCAIVGNAAQRGGGIYMWGTGTLWLIDSTVADNTATAENGAGGVDVFRSNVRIMNSTISGNKSTSSIDGAGGIRLAGSENWFINGSTVAYNSALGSAQTSAGGLVAPNGIPGPLSNVILAKNTGINPDFYGRSSGAKNSFIGITDQTSGFINGVNGNIVGSANNPADPQLGMLTDNGGGLPTHALSSSSAAINAGNNALSINRQGQPLTIDQRGFHRIVNLTVDIGSYEYGSQPLAADSTISGQVTGANGRGISGALVTLRDPQGRVRFAYTNPFGFYRAFNVESGLNYSIECSGKRGAFSIRQNILIEEAVEHINFSTG